MTLKEALTSIDNANLSPVIKFNAQISATNLNWLRETGIIEELHFATSLQNLFKHLGI